MKLKQITPEDVELDDSRIAEFAVSMGFDAFRICIGIRPRSRSIASVVEWVRSVAAQIEQRAIDRARSASSSAEKP